MAINIDALFQHLMEDPDLVPSEGEDKEDIAMAMARQRAKQSNNNTKALSMAADDRSISKLLAFLLKAEGETDEEKQFRAEFKIHQDNFDKHHKKIESAEKRGDEPRWAKMTKGERKGEISVKGKADKKAWEDAKEFLEINMPAIVEEHEQTLEAIRAGTDVAVTDDEEDDAPAETPTTTPQMEGEVTRAARLEEEE